MANHQLLDNVTHKNLRVITERSAWYGDDMAATITFPLEFRRVQAEYPIAFQKNAESGHFEPIAIFGFEEGENLFLGKDGWEADYVPLTIERQPFLIGFTVNEDGGVPLEEPVVHVDMDSPRISETDGVPVFLEHGGLSPYLERINSVLNAVHSGYLQNQEFSELLESLELLEPFQFQFDLDDGRKQTLGGLYTLHEERLAALDGDALAKLHAAGYLESVYMAMASIANFRTLIERKKKRT